MIEADCATDNFDATLQKYKDEHQRADRTPANTLFDRFTEWKKRRVYKRTLEKYKGLSGHLKDYFKDRAAISIGENEAFRFKDYLLESLAHSTVKERIGLLKACWDWAIAQKIVEGNPWSEVRVKVPPKPKPKPLTKEEVEKVLKAFESSEWSRHYLKYLLFLLGTGARTGEVIGLQWRHVSSDCSQVWIGEMLSRGTRKETKNNQARTLSLPQNLQEMLREIKENNSPKDHELVFKAPEGGPINDHNFRNRAWKKCLERAGVEYRKPYITRSTFISHALAAGMNPVDIAELTGHDVETLYREYAGSIESTPKVPRLDWSN